jgi:competence ComEA-like helix-hairpin-helix protein
MARRFLAIRFLLITCLLFGTSVFAKKKPPAQPVNINAATSEELQLVPGIGPSTADKILQMRKSYGPFKSVDDLLAIRGIGPKRLEKMRKYLVAGKPNANNGSPATGCSGCAKPKSPAVKLPVKTSTKPATSQSGAEDEEPFL